MTVATRCSAPVSDSPSRSSAARAPAVSPCARLWAASLSAVPAAPSAWEAVASSSASWRASSRCSAAVRSSRLLGQAAQGPRGPHPGRHRGSHPVVRWRRATSCDSATPATPRAARWPDRSGRGPRPRSPRARPGWRPGSPAPVAVEAPGRAAPGQAASADRWRPRPSTPGPRQPGQFAPPGARPASCKACCWAMTASCGFGSRRTGASSNASRSAW